MIHKFWLIFAIYFLAGCHRATERVVLYCAQDRPFAEPIFAEFTRTTGVALVPKYDSEANKSVGLFRELQLEVKHPRCDVHWNNEIITTLMLAHDGILEPYDSPAAAPFPDFAKAADHTWHAFAARARVLIINTEKLGRETPPTSLLDLTDPRWSGRLVMAKPNFGTTATHAVCLFEVLGAEQAKSFFRGLSANKIAIMPGNKQVAEAVGRGEFAVGMTDTDDAMDEINNGRPVRIIFPDAAGGTEKYPRMGTLFIPNTVAVVKGAPNPTAARKLVDYLLSPEVEEKLAVAGGYQIPLNPNVKADLPAALSPARQAKPMKVDFGKAAAMWDEMQTFLRNEFAR
ncbi:MAG: extracellular solute-binding protein [Gemmataceae bacterium]